jgi:hypothetical protein
MPKRKTKSTESDVIFVNPLLEAVKHCMAAQRSKGDELMTHSLIRYGQILAFDRTVAAGAPVIEDDLDCAPHTDRLRMALERCGPEYQIVQEPTSLFTRSGEFSAYVPLCDPGKLSTPVPDAPIAPLGDAFRAALKATGPLVKDSAPTVLQSCIQLNSFSCVATNGSVIVEAWHGFDMPPGLLIPKSFCDAVVKSKRKIVSFGFSMPEKGEATFTVWFEGRFWYRTLLFREKIPDMMSKFVNVDAWHPVPEGFFAQVGEIAKWSEDGKVYIADRKISSHPPDKQQVGSCLSFPLEGMQQDVWYSITSLKAIGNVAAYFNDDAPNVMMFSDGNVVRGVVARLPIHETLRCHRCGCEMKGGICQNYGCETPRGPQTYDSCKDCVDGECTGDCIPF